MLRYTLERIVLIVITIFLILTFNFFLLRADGNSPFENPKLTATQKQLMMEKYGLDRPMVVQYVEYLKQFVKGDLGVSLTFHNNAVWDLIKIKLPHTTRVGLQSLLVGTVLGILLGSFAAIYRGGMVDSLVTIFAVIMISIPSFVMAAYLSHFLAYKWKLLPYTYLQVDPSRGIDIWESFKSTIMPTIAIASGITASIMRYARSELIEVLNSDYILLARAKGLNKTKVIFRHALRNAFIPIITILGPMVLNVIYGSIIVEQFFNVPGLSTLMLGAIQKHDYFLTMGINMMYSIFYVVVMLIIDLLYGVIDPRIRLSGGDR